MVLKNNSDYFLHFQKDGVTESFAPGDKLPDWVADRITNPLVTGDGVEEDGAIVEKKPKPKTRTKEPEQEPVEG